eukprot:2874002-Rhodomonas_salina.1
MLRGHVDVKLAASGGSGTSMKDILLTVTSNVVVHAPQALRLRGWAPSPNVHDVCAGVSERVRE